MKEKEAFKFCPKCIGSLEKSPLGEDHLKCSKCGFDLFLNSKPCSACIIFKNKKVLLTKRASNPWAGLWELPGGFLEKQESLEEGLKRELKEELGIEVTNQKYFISLSGDYQIKEVLYNVLVSFFFAIIKGT